MFMPLHRDFLDYYRLLKVSTARGRSILYQFMNSEDLWNEACNNMGFLQTLFTGIDEHSVPADDTAYTFIDIIKEQSARHEKAVLCYWTFLGLTVHSTMAATIADASCIAAIKAIPEAYAALLTVDNGLIKNAADVVTMFSTADNTAHILNSPYQTKNIVENITSSWLPMQTLRNNTTALNNYKAHRKTSTSVTVPDGCHAAIVAIIGQGGQGGRSGYYTRHSSCCYSYYAGQNGSAGALSGSAANRATGSTQASQNYGGGGGCGGIEYVAIEVTPGTTLTWNNNNITGAKRVLARTRVGLTVAYQTFFTTAPVGGTTTRTGVAGFAVHSGAVYGSGGTGGAICGQTTANAGTVGNTGCIECYFAY